jgi:hypothetical protein
VALGKESESGVEQSGLQKKKSVMTIEESKKEERVAGKQRRARVGDWQLPNVHAASQATRHCICRLLRGFCCPPSLAGFFEARGRGRKKTKRRVHEWREGLGRNGEG